MQVLVVAKLHKHWQKVTIFAADFLSFISTYSKTVLPSKNYSDNRVPKFNGSPYFKDNEQRNIVYS